VPSRSSKELLETNTAEYQRQLKGSPGESTLLARGLTPQTIQNFRLGYVDSPISGDEMYKNRITIPYQTVSGIVSMRFKLVDGDGPKMLVHPGEQGRPYNVGALSGSGPLFIVEGEPDVWIGWQCGLLTLGFPGAKTWKKIYRRILMHWDVTILADGDEPGLELAEEIAKDIRGVAKRQKIISFPKGEDLNSMFLEYGSTGIREWLGIDE
jgi:DNA primase